MFMIPEGDPDTGLVNFEQVYVLDAASRSLRREEVIRESSSPDPLDNVLRIRCCTMYRRPCSDV